MTELDASVDAAAPTSFEQAAATLAGAAGDGRAVRIAGGATKLGWGNPQEPSLILRTGGLDRTIEHNAGDLTAIFAAGVPLARAQAELAEHGQRIALDPPLGPPGSSAGAGAATIGGVFAAGDSGPLRHRYGLPRDLILGVTVALSDGTIARAGGKVIKNVAGYDLAKLFTGSFGTLGLILSVSVRLHPLPEVSATALGAAADPDRLRTAALALARAPLELEALDVAWRGGRGGLLARAAGPEAARRCTRAAAVMREAGLQGVDVTEQDDPLWARQRAGQRSATRAALRVAARPTELPAVLRAADAGGATLVGRAAHGTYWLELAVSGVPAALAALPVGAVAVLLDLPQGADVPEGFGADRWNRAADSGLELMRELKRRFDPAGVCNPGLFVGGI